MTVRNTPLPTLPERLQPGHTALLVIDMQNDFCAENGFVERVVGKDASACRAVAAPIGQLVQDARAAQVPVFWIVANYDPDKVPAGMLAKQREKSFEICCGTGSWGAEFYGVAPGAGESVVEKHCFSAFIDTGLAEKLAERGIRTIVYAGVQTNICVESSLRDGVNRGFHAVLASDCVASHTPPLHEATLMNTRFLFGDVLTRGEIVAHWNSAT